MSAGRFVWRELVSASPAVSFYTQLFGWTAKPMQMGGGTYTLFHDDALGEDTGGAMVPPMEGVPSHWLDYITVNDLDAAAAAVKAGGGAVVTDVIKVPGVGTWFIATDPEGAAFAPFIGDSPGATPDRKAPAGTFCWAQLMTGDVDAAVAFYTRVFGWSAAPMGEVIVLSTGDVQRATIARFPEGRAMPANWLNYLAVADVDATYARALSLGATSLMGPAEMGTMGRFAVLADPCGAVFALWTQKA